MNKMLNAVSCGMLGLAMLLLGACVSAPAAAPAKTGGSAGGSAPVWLTDLESAYPDADFLAAVASGDTRKAAEANAAAAVAGRFKLNVQSDFKGQERYLELVKGNSSYSQMESSYLNTVNTSTGNQQFSNLKYSDPYTDAKGMVNVVAYLDRKETAKLYQSLIKKDVDVVTALRERTKTASTSLVKFAFYDTALQVSRNSERLLEQLRLIHAQTAKVVEPTVQTDAILKERDAVAQTLSYKLTVEGDADGKIGGILKKTMSELGISENAAGNLRLDAKILTEKVDVNPNFKSVRWTLSASLVDENGNAVANMFKEARENGITDKEAASFALMEAEKAVKKDFLKKITAYFDSVSMGK